MAVPVAVQTQINNLNSGMNKIVKDRERLNSIFESDLGGSIWDLLSAGEKTAVKNAICGDLYSARDQISAAIDALAAM